MSMTVMNEMNSKALLANVILDKIMRKHKLHH